MRLPGDAGRTVIAMRCGNCSFENLPGGQLCARCGSRLTLDDVSFEPPRAGRHGGSTALRRAGYRLRESMPDFRKFWQQLRIVTPEPVDRRALAWSFIPGLGHLKTGRPQWGWVLLSTWLTLFVLLLLSIGTDWAQFALSGMVLVHTLAVITLLAANLEFERLWVRAAFGIAAFLMIQFFVYRPAVWTCGRILVAVSLPRAGAGDVIQDGDGLLCLGPWLRPEVFARGDIVLYQMDDLELPGVIIRSGFCVNRVVGVPGDRVARKDGILTVNGEVPDAAHGPLGRPPPLGDFEFELRPREFAVFTALRLQGFIGHRPGQVIDRTAVRHLSVVSYDAIVGRVIFRLHPLRRMGRVG